MKHTKISVIIVSIIWILIALFLYLRPTDGAGVTNTPLNQLISLGIWLIVGVIAFSLIWHRWHHQK